MSKNILLVDTNFSSKPIYDNLINMGYNVYVVGGNKDDFLAKTVDNYLNFDYSNINIIIKIIEEYKIELILPGCNDFSYYVCSKVNEMFFKYKTIDSVDNFTNLNNKAYFKLIAKDIGLSTPLIYDNINEINKFPVIVKPVDSFSGKGNIIVENKEQLKTSVSYAESYSKSKKIIIEDYIQGQLFSYSSFIYNDKILIDFIVQEDCIANKFAVDTSRVIFDFPQKILKKLRQEVLILYKKLLLTNGLMHVQFILDNNNDDYWLIEITRRCPGDLYSSLIYYSTGFNYAKYYIEPLLGINSMINFNLVKKSIIRHTITSKKSGRFIELSFNHPISMKSFLILSQSGDFINEAPQSRLGLIFIDTKDKKEFDFIYNSLLGRELYDIKLQY
jgi:biotin carboxylase